MSEAETQAVLDRAQAVSDRSRLRKEKNELIAALIALHAKPRCSRCRKAVRAVLDRIKFEYDEGVTNGG